MLETVFWVLVLLGVMILIHELGHYWAALACGVKVETFSFGFGPRLFGFRRGATDFRISAIPFGGYVRMLGEQAGDDHAVDPRSFQAKPRWQRAIVIFAGPLMNVVLAVAIGTGLFMHAYPKYIDSTNPVIGKIQPGSPADQSGLQVGDRILQIGNQKSPSWMDVQTTEALHGGQTLKVLVERKGVKRNFEFTPLTDPKSGTGLAGWFLEPGVVIAEVAPNMAAAQAGLRPGDLLLTVAGQPVTSLEGVQKIISQANGQPVEVAFMRDGGFQEVSVTPVATAATGGQARIGILFGYEVVKLPFPAAVAESVRWNAQRATLLYQVLDSIVERRMSARTLDGPIGIARRSKEAAHEGAVSFFDLMAMVSLNLAVFNLLPIPLLDGGVLLLLFIEMLIRRDVSLQVKEAVFKLGFVFLMMIVVFVIYNDISKLFTNG